jgi:polyisoprenoid-binding protein YceI
MRAWVMAAGLLFVASASAQETPAPQAAPAYEVRVDEPAGTYRADPRHTSVIFRIRHLGLSWFTARFDTKEATLELNRDDPSQSRLTASVDATTVNTGVLNRDGERGFDAQIGRALGGGAITFTSTSIRRTGAETARVTGDLTMNGQTHPATLNVTFEGSTTDILRGANRVLAFSAVGEIDRTEWGVDEWDAFTGDTVQIVIETELVKS